jgi:3',5'-cyclic AMP phosphodiesterase CpdA
VTVPTGAAPPVSIRIAHVSDLHFGDHDPVAVEALLADVYAARPALTVVTGDSTMRARTDQFRRAEALLARLPAPRLVVLGNHDIPLAVLPRLVRPYARFRAQLCDDLDPVVRIPGLTAVGLNSMPRWRWKNGAVKRRQCAAVAETLRADAADTVRLVALHHSPFAVGSARLVGRTRLLAALVEARVDLVLAGHTHVPAARRLTLAAADRTHTVFEVVAGTATSGRTRGTARSWSLIRVDRDAIGVQVHYQVDGRWGTTPTVRFSRPS